MKKPLQPTPHAHPKAPLQAAGMRAQHLLVWFLALPILLYRKLLSPLLGPRCRFYPSCSLYALQALRLYGPFRGSWLSLRRLSRCHPFHPGGLDSLPPPGENTSLPCEKTSCPSHAYRPSRSLQNRPPLPPKD